MPVIEQCTCGGEDSDGRMDVLRCPVHGPRTYWQPTGDLRTDDAVRAVIVAAWETLRDAR